MAFSKFNPNFLVLPDPIFYSLSELLLSLRHLLDLWEAFLRVFSNLSNFLLNWANNCFAGLGFLPAFLAAGKSAFTVLSFSYLRQSLVACVVCAPPCFLHSSQDLSKHSGGLLKKRWNLVLEKQFKETLLLVSHWTRALVGASEISCPLGGILAVMSSNTFVGAAP
jgi:hypothetical protein